MIKIAFRFILALQFGILAPLTSYARTDGDRHTVTSDSAQAAELVATDAMRTVFQTRRTTNLKTGETKEYSLGRVDVSNPFLALPGDLSTLRYEVVENSATAAPANFELHIIYRENGSEHRHIFPHFTAFTSPPKFYPDGNLLNFATTEGLFTIPLVVFKDALFSAPVPVIQMDYVDSEHGEKIVDIQTSRVVTADTIEQASREQAYRQFLELPLLLQDPNISDEATVLASDIVVKKVRPAANGTLLSDVVVIDREAFTMELAKRLTMIHFLALAHNPNPAHLADLGNIQAAYGKEVADIYKKYNSAVEQLAPDQQDLVKFSLDQMLRKEGSRKGLQLATPNRNGRSTLGAIASQERDRFTIKEVRDNWEKFAEERDRVLNTDEKKAKGRLKGLVAGMIARGLSTMKKDFTINNLRQMSDSSKKILGATAGVIAAGLGTTYFAPDAATFIVQTTLSSIDQFGSLVANGLGPIVAPYSNTIHKIAHQWLHIGIATASLTGILSVMVALNALTMQSNRVRSWTPYQKFFKRLTTYFSSLNYPVAAQIWEKILKQKLVYGAIDHGYLPNQLPDSEDTGRSIVRHDSAASPAAVAEQARIVNRYIESDANRNRATFLKALGEASQTYKIDVATLTIAAQASTLSEELKKENVPTELLQENSLSANLASPDLWNEVNDALKNDYNWLADKHVPNASPDKLINPQLLEQLRAYFKQVAEKEKSNSENTNKLKAMWRAGVKAMSVRVLYNPSARHFSQTFGHGSEPSERISSNAGAAVNSDYLLSFGFVAPLTMTADMEGWGNLISAPIDSSSIHAMTDAQIARSPYAGALAGEQIALGGTLYIGAALDASEEKLSEPANQPRSSVLFERHGASKSQKAVARAKAAEMIKGVYDRAGLTYTADDTKFNERQASIADSAQAIRGSFIRQVDNDGHEVDPGWARYLDRSMMQVSRLVGDSMQGQLVNNTLWMSLIMIGGVAVNQVFGAHPLHLATLDGAFQLGKTVAAGVFSGFMAAFSILLIKYTFLGYAIYWGPVHEFSYALARAVSNDRGATMNGLNYIESGSRTNDLAREREGVKVLLTLIQTSAVDAKIAKPNGELLNLDPAASANYSQLEAAVLFKYFMHYAPLATKANHFVHDVLVNMGLGAVTTTVMAYMFTYKYIAGGIQSAFDAGLLNGIARSGEVGAIGIGALATHLFLVSYFRPGPFQDKVNTSIGRAYTRTMEKFSAFYPTDLVSNAKSSAKAMINSCVDLLKRRK